MWLNCKVIKKCQPPSPPFISASTSPFQVYPPFLAKNFVPTQVTQFSEGGGGVFNYVYITAFACNAKTFAIAILVFLLLLYFLLVAVFPETAKSFFINVSSFLTQETWDQDCTYFTGHTKSSLRKNCSFKLLLATSRAYEKSCHYLW